jgi:hypothetical protein
MRLQRCDVAIKCAQADSQLTGQRSAAHRKTMATQYLHQLKKPLGTRHTWGPTFVALLDILPKSVGMRTAAAILNPRQSMQAAVNLPTVI